MSARLVLDELDLNLSSLATGLVIVVVVVVGSAGTWSLHAAALALLDAIAVADTIVVAGRRVLVVFGEFAGHDSGVGGLVVASSQDYDGLGTLFDRNG